MSDYWVCLTPSKYPYIPTQENASKLGGSALHIQFPEYDTQFGFFPRDLVVRCTAVYKTAGALPMIYHAGHDRSMLKGLAWLAGLLVGSAAVVATARTHTQNVLKTQGEEQLIAGLRGTMDVSQLGGKRLGDVAVVWHYLSDAHRFPEEGYYVLDSNPPTQGIRGKIKKEHLYPYP